MQEKEKKENIKEILKDYSKVKFEIANLENKKKQLESDEYDVSITANYSAIPSAGGVNDKVFNAVAKRDQEIEKIDKLIKEKKTYLEMVDNLISNLKYKEQEVVKKRAIEHKDFYTIVDELAAVNIYYSDEYCRKLYYNCIDKLQGIYNLSSY